MGNAVNSPYSFKGYSYTKTPSVIWFINTNGVDLNGLSERTRKAVRSYLEKDAAPEILHFMKSNHKWQNRTYTAETGLECKLAKTGNLRKEKYFATLQMYHTATHNGYEYGRALEGIDPIHGVYRKDLGVLEDTLLVYTPQVVEGMKGILDKYS